MLIESVDAISNVSCNKLAIYNYDKFTNSHDLNIFDLEKLKFTTKLTRKTRCFGPLKLLDDGYLFGGSKEWYENTCCIWDTQTGKCLHAIGLRDYAVEAFSTLPDGHIVVGLVSHYALDSKCIIVEKLTGELVGEIELDAMIINLATLGNGHLVVIGRNQDKVQILTYPDLLPERFLIQEGEGKTKLNQAYKF